MAIVFLGPPSRAIVRLRVSNRSRWSSTLEGGPLSIVNTRSASSAAFTELETAWEPSGRSEHYLRGRNRLNGPCELDRSTGKSLLKKWLILGSVFDDAIGDTRHLGCDRGQRLTLSIGVNRIRVEITAILYAELVLAQVNRTQARHPKDHSEPLVFRASIKFLSHAIDRTGSWQDPVRST